jgi:indole-3-glycerol phosphate synthase
VAKDSRVDDPCHMVSERERVRIIVEIDRAEPLRGTIAEPEQPVRTFHGWTAFASAVAAVVQRFGTSRSPGEVQPDEGAGG